MGDPGAQFVTFTEPGQEWVRQNCFGAFASYVGMPVEQSRYDLRVIFLVPDAWAGGLRRMFCAVANLDTSPLAQSVKGTAK